MIISLHPRCLATQICGGLVKHLKILTKKPIKVGGNADRGTGWELLDKHHKASLQKQIRLDRPLFLTFSFPCKFHGGWTGFNKWRDPENYTKAIKCATQMSRWCATLAMEQLDRGLEFFLEHSGNTDIMADDLWLKVLKHPRVKTWRSPMCAHGLESPDGGPIEKMARFMTTSQHVMDEINRPCPGHSSHKVISGYCQGYKLSTYVQTWTPKLNSRLANGMIATARSRGWIGNVAAGSRNSWLVSDAEKKSDSALLDIAVLICPKCTGKDKKSKHTAIPGECRIASLRSFD